MRIKIVVAAMMCASVPLVSIAQDVRARNGVTKSGHAFEIYPDGSAFLKAAGAQWSIDCRRDKITDRRDCNMTGGDDMQLFVNFDHTGKISSICALGHDFPGRTGAIRFGSNKAVSTDSDGCISGLYAKQMAASRTAVTRTVKWPYDYYVDSETSIEGQADAIALVRSILSQR